MADTPTGAGHADSIASQDSGPNKTEKKKTRRPASKPSPLGIRQPLRMAAIPIAGTEVLTRISSNRYRVPAAEIEGMAVRSP
jgi:hypothetical protein